MRELDRRTLGRWHKPERKGKHFALRSLASSTPLIADELQDLAVVTIELEPPGMAVDEQQLADADFGIERQLAAAAVAAADHLDGEIDRPGPILALVLSRTTGENYNDIRSTIILRPSLDAIAHVHAGQNLAQA